jgi:ABC-type branched-subunit amino acid transport system substrate-binding protein
MKLQTYKNMVAIWTLLLLAFNSHAAAGISQTEIVIGQTSGVTGPSADVVKEITEGANAYFALTSRGGGIFGRKITLVSLDDKLDPKLAVNNAKELDKRVFALVLGRGTPSAEALMPVLSELKLPLISPSTGASSLHSGANRYVFNIRAKYQSEVAAAVRHFSTVGINRIAFVHVDDGFGKDALIGFNASMGERSIKPVSVVPFDRFNKDMGAVMKVALDSAPQAIILVGPPKTSADAIRKLRESGSAAQVLCLSNVSSASFLKDLGSHAHGVIVSQVYPAPTSVSELGRELQVAAKELGFNPTYASIEGFAAAKVVVEGLRRAGPNPTRESFVAALEGIRNLDLGGMQISYGPKDRSGSEYVDLSIVGKGGQYLR